MLFIYKIVKRGELDRSLNMRYYLLRKCLTEVNGMAKPRKITEEKREQIRAEYATGMYTYPELAVKYAVHVNTIFRICKEESYQTQLASNRLYQKRNVKEIYERRRGSHKMYSLTLHKETDADLIAKLDSVENYSAYLRSLLLDALAKEQSDLKSK